MKHILFIWIPKCAGTTISRHLKLHRQVGNRDFRYNFDNNKSVTFGHADINIILEKKIVSNNFYKNSFKFCVVRNPYDRAVSLYFYQLSGKLIKNNWSFDIWVKHLYENRDKIPKNNDRNLSKKELINNQWNLMISWIPNDIDKVYYFEDGIEYIINDINKNIGEEQNISPIKQHNSSDHKNYKTYYKNETTKKYIYEIYKEDFVRFNYSKDI